MTRLPPFFRPRRLVRVLTVAFTAAALPTLASAQAAANRGHVDDKDAPTIVDAEQMTGRPDREIQLERDVEITRGATNLKADRAKYDIVDDTVEASGNVRMKRSRDSYTGDELKLKLDTGQGYVLNPTYQLELNRAQAAKAQGRADRIDFEARDRATVEDGTYSTCEAPDPDWYLKSSTLDLDTSRDIGTASKAVVYFKGVPILATPTMSFPLSGSRKSGVLPPTIGTTNKGGLEIMVPYYFNIAPNRDLTLYPRIISQRGLQMGAAARYLGETYTGTTKVEVLPDDKLRGTSRYAFSSTHVQSFASGFTFSENLNGASDGDYPNDFPTTLTAASQRLLLRDVALGYAGSFWNATARTTSYQILQDPLAPIVPPYDRLPQITYSAAQQNVGGLDWSFGSELTRFWHPDLVRGDRFVVNPRASYPIISPGYFLTPSFSVSATTYSLSNQATGLPTSFDRVLPTFSLDSGLVFERDTSFFGAPATQTLEPRLFYVYTPFKDQSQFPNFDSALADFSYAQLFSENRFIGNDRISDANQLTAAVVSRYIEPSGAERMRFALGQRFYFNDQLVAQQAAGLTTPSETKSDLLLAASGQVSTALGVDASLQYSQGSKKLNRAIFGMRWQPSPRHVLNAQYRRDIPTALDLIDVSAQWPVAKRWYAVGRVNYSILEKKLAESFLGMEYKADCWVLRIVGQRIPTATGVAASSVFFQLELNGLSRIGSNPLQLLRTNIPGYQMVNQP